MGFFRRKKKKERKKQNLDEIQNSLNSMFEESESEPEQVKKYSIKLSDKEKEDILNEKIPRKKTGLAKLCNFIKKHVRPDIGLTDFEEGEEISLEEDDLPEIGEKIKRNLRVGLKLTFRF